MSRAARGFTLLEVLMAVLLLAVLIGGAYGGLRASANAMRAGEAAIDRTDRLRTAQEFLRRQISNILPLGYGHNDQQGLNIVFEGAAQTMRFVAPMPGYLSRGGPYVQTLELVNGKNGLQLQFTDTILNGYDSPDNTTNRSCCSIASLPAVSSTARSTSRVSLPTGAATGSIPSPIR